MIFSEILVIIDQSAPQATKLKNWIILGDLINILSQKAENDKKMLRKIWQREKLIISLQYKCGVLPTCSLT